MEKTFTIEQSVNGFLDGIKLINPDLTLNEGSKDMIIGQIKDHVKELLKQQRKNCVSALKKAEYQTNDPIKRWIREATEPNIDASIKLNQGFCKDNLHDMDKDGTYSICVNCGFKIRIADPKIKS